MNNQSMNFTKTGYPAMFEITSTNFIFKLGPKLLAFGEEFALIKTLFLVTL